MITLYHVRGPEPCGQPAIYLKARIELRYEMPADNVVKLDGQPPLRGEPMLCGSCGGGTHPMFLSYAC